MNTPLSGEQVFQAFIAQARADPTYLSRLAATFNYAPPFKKSAPILPLPFRRLKTVEVAIEDRGQPKASSRLDRVALQFSCTIQVTTPASSQISKPCWRGRAQFRSPQRMAKDAVRFCREKKIDASYRDWLLQEIIPRCVAQDWMVGCIRIETDGQGTPYAHQQVILADRLGLEAHQLDNAYLLSGDNILVKLPRFVGTYPGGKKLAGGFALQSRGKRSHDASKAGWATGDIEVAA